MPSGKITKLFGKAAPELDGAVAWKHTDPLTMKGLKGKVVVLDFWSFSCSICLHHKPDLAKLQEKFKDKPLAVLTVHDGSAETMEDVDAKVPDPIKKLVHRYMTNPTHLQMTPEVLTVDKIRQSYFTVDKHRKFELLVKVVGPERILFGTETPGTGSGFDPKTGRHLDNMLPYVSQSPLLSEQERTAILSENASRLFKLADVPAVA